MGEVMEFAAREDFRAWLSENCLTSGGVWLLFGKPGGPKTIKAGEALEEARQMSSNLCEKTIKYFTRRVRGPRRTRSRRSESPKSREDNC